MSPYMVIKYSTHPLAIQPGIPTLLPNLIEQIG